METIAYDVHGVLCEYALAYSGLPHCAKYVLRRSNTSHRHAFANAHHFVFMPLHGILQTHKICKKIIWKAAVSELNSIIIDQKVYFFHVPFFFWVVNWICIFNGRRGLRPFLECNCIFGHLPNHFRKKHVYMDSGLGVGGFHNLDLIIVRKIQATL